MINMDKASPTNFQESDSQQVFVKQVKKGGYFCLLILIFWLQLFFLMRIFVEVDHSTYTKAVSEIYVGPNWRYGYGTGLGGITWIKTANIEQETLCYFQISSIRDIAFVKLMEKFFAELFLYFCIITFLFWGSKAILNKLDRYFDSGRVLKYCGILVAWTVVILPLIMFQYGAFTYESWIPQSFNPSGYYENSTITYRAIIDFVNFVPYKFVHWIGLEADILYKPFGIYILGVLFISVLSLLGDLIIRVFRRLSL